MLIADDNILYFGCQLINSIAFTALAAVVKAFAVMASAETAHAIAKCHFVVLKISNP